MRRPEGFDERPEPPAAKPAASGAPKRAARGTARRSPDETTPSETAPSSQSGVSWRRLGTGLAGRLRDLSPDEDYRDPDAAPSRTVTDLLPGPDGDQDADSVSRPDSASDPASASDPTSGSDPSSLRPDQQAAPRDETPIGARVRAAETAREARAARKRRRLVERAEIRRFTRRSRHRRVAWLAAGSVFVVLVLAVVVAVYSPLMALTTISIQGTSRVDRAAVQRALDSQLGTPLARVDLGEIKQKLKGFPLIESYVTEEEPPHTLVVTITEREPIVAVKTGSGYDLVDPAGIVVESDPNKPAGMPVADVDASQLGSAVYRSMTEVVLSLPASVRATVTDVTATTADDVTLTLDGGAKVVWGSPDSSTAKAALLAALIKDHDARDPSASVEYDVSAPDNGIIRQQQ